jgi:hypothetical protein
MSGNRDEGEDEASSTGQRRAFRDRPTPPPFHERRENDERIAELERELAALKARTEPVVGWFAKMTATGQTLGSLRGLAQWILIAVAVMAAAKTGLLNFLGIGGKGNG